MTRSRMTIVALALSLVLLAACGTSSKNTSTGTTSAGGAAGAPVALSGTVNDRGTTDLSSQGATPQLAMELNDDFFSPTFVQAEPGATVALHLTNKGATVHTFTLDDKSIDQTLQPGATATVEVTVPASGSLRFSCDFHGAMGMQGAFFTTSASTAPAGGGATTTTPPKTSRGY